MEAEEEGKGKEEEDEEPSEAKQRLMALEGQGVLDAGLVERMLVRRGQREDAGRGAVDGLRSELCAAVDAAEIAKGVAKALPQATLAVLSFTEEAFAERVKALKEAASRDLESQSGPRNLKPANQKPRILKICK